MDARDVIKVGMSAERTLVVPPERTVGHLSRACPMVYATPMMIMEMEMASADAHQAASLAPGWVTVGTEVDIRHLAASAVGAVVRTTARVIAVERRVIRFEVEAFDGERRIGEGRHARGLVNSRELQQALWRLIAVILRSGHLAASRRMEIGVWPILPRRRFAAPQDDDYFANLPSIAWVARGDRAGQQRLHAVRSQSALRARLPWCRRARSRSGGKCWRRGVRAMQQLAGAGHGFAREFWSRGSCGQAGLDAGARQLFDRDRNIGRARTRTPPSHASIKLSSSTHSTDTVARNSASATPRAARR